MAPKKPKTAKKKKAAKKKPSTGNLWFEYNYQDGKDVSGIMRNVIMTRAQIEAACKQNLASTNVQIGTSYKTTDFVWTALGGKPSVTKLKVYITPKPTKKGFRSWRCCD